MSDDSDYFVTDTGKLVLPPDVQRAVDALVSAFRAGKRNKRAYRRLTDWLDKYGDDIIFDGYKAGILGLSPSTMRTTFEDIDDDEVAKTMDLASLAEVTDAHRVAYLEEHIFPGLFEDSDDSSGMHRRVVRIGNNHLVAERFQVARDPLALRASPPEEFSREVGRRAPR